ncbi:porin [Chitinimonas lacunae]|uniref:Porin n=1 Tax=Chitinimonas lacunae TaxID=1963018 RepID=A0ABV8MM69_9NEIS
MNRTLLAAAVTAALAAPAQADDGIVIYGKMTMGVESVSAKGATLPNQTIERRMRVTDGFSTIGFRGQEEINDDLVAYYQIETQIKPDDSCGFAGCSTQGQISGLGLPFDDRYGRYTSPHTGGVNLANRPSFVGLRGNWGQIQLGRMDMYYDKHVPNEMHLLRTGLSSTALAVLGTNQLSNAAGLSDTNVYRTAFRLELLPIVSNAAGGRSNAGTEAVATAVAAVVGEEFAKGTAPLDILPKAQLAAQQATVANLSALGLTPGQLQEYSVRLAAGLTSAANQIFAPGSNELKQRLTQVARAYTLQYAFYNVGHRENNVVQYRTPSYKGFTALIGVKANEDKGIEGVEYGLDPQLLNPNARRKLNPYGVELTLHYLNKGMFASLAAMYDHDPYPMGGVLTGALGIKASYGMYFSRQTRAGVVFERQTNRYHHSLGFDDNKRDTWVVAASHRFNDQLEAFATYGQALDAEIHGIRDRDSGAKYLQLTGIYNLSRRTNLFATVARVENEANAAYNFYVNGAVQADGAIQSSQYTPRGSDPTSLQVGINHNF